MLRKVDPSSTFWNKIFQLATQHAVVIRATTSLTCSATMLRDKFNKNVPLILGLKMLKTLQ